MKLLLKILCFALSFVVCCVSCTSKREIFFIADYNGLISINDNNPQLLTQLPGNNYIHTGSSSYCVVQYGKKGFIIIYGNSDVNIDTNIFGDSDRLIISISQGIVDIVYSSKEKDVAIKTDTCLVSGDVQNLRVLSHQNYACIVNIDSKITVNYIENSKEYSKFIDKNKIFITTGIASAYFDATAQVIDFFKELKHVRYAIPGKNVSVFIPLGLKNIMQELGNRNIKDDILLTMLEKQKGPLKKIVTKNGVIYKGYVTAKGKNLEIMTIQGIVSIPQSNVKYVLSFQPMYDN